MSCIDFYDKINKLHWFLRWDQTHYIWRWEEGEEGDEVYSWKKHFIYFTIKVISKSNANELLWFHDKIKILQIFLMVGQPRDPKGEDHGYLTTFTGINAPKSGPLKYENNAQTIPK